MPDPIETKRTKNREKRPGRNHSNGRLGKQQKTRCTDRSPSVEPFEFDAEQLKKQFALADKKESDCEEQQKEVKLVVVGKEGIIRSTIKAPSLGSQTKETPVVDKQENDSPLTDAAETSGPGSLVGQLCGLLESFQDFNLETSSEKERQDLNTALGKVFNTETSSEEEKQALNAAFDKATAVKKMMSHTEATLAGTVASSSLEFSSEKSQESFPDRYTDRDPEYATVLDTSQMPPPMWGDLALATPVDKKKTRQKSIKSYRCGIFFGTFDPIHDNHVRLFKNALEHHLDVLYIVVNEGSYGKEIKTPTYHRKLMVTERLLEDDLRPLNIHMFTPRMKCFDWYGRNGVSSAIHQMEAKKKNCPVAMFQIIGEDSFFRPSAVSAIEKLSKSHGINRSFLVYPRIDTPYGKSQEQAKTLRNFKVAFNMVNYTDPIQLSSTNVRRDLAELCRLRLCIDYKEVFEKMKNCLHKTTLIYISNFRLYHVDCARLRQSTMIEVD